MRTTLSTLLLFAAVAAATGLSLPASGSEVPPPEARAAESLLEIGPAEPPSPSERRWMHAWHRIWEGRTREVRRAWKRLLERLAGPWPIDPSSQCAALGRSLAALDSEALFPAPDPTVDLHLRRGLRELDRAARTCRRERLFETTHRLERARRAFDQAGRALARYDLEP